MNKDKTTSQIIPTIGDIVHCGPPGQTAVVTSIDPEGPNTANASIINCCFDGQLNLNRPDLAVLAQAVDCARR